MMTPIYIQIANSLRGKSCSLCHRHRLRGHQPGLRHPGRHLHCTQFFPAGYKYMDYMKIGKMPLAIILMIAAAALAPISVYPYNIRIPSYPFQFPIRKRPDRSQSGLFIILLRLCVGN